MLSVTRRVRVRWWMFGFTCAFAFIAYVQRQTVTVAGERMMPDLSFSQMQIGMLYWAFIAGYTCFQLAGGIYGQRLGARRAFIVMSLIAFAATVATPVAPVLFAGTALFAVLMTSQCVLGIAQAPVFPVSAGVYETWFPASRWSMLWGVQSTFMNLGAALTPPLIAHLMHAFGWQQALAWSSLPALGVIALWAWYGRDTPAQHRGVTAGELAELRDMAPAAAPVTAINWPRLQRLLCDRNVLLISLSYLCMNYVFYLLSGWCFLYLVKERHFTVLESGWLSSLPPLGAAVGAGAGGKIGTWLFVRYGARWGFRMVPLVAMPLGGLLLIAAVELDSPYWAAAALAAAYAAVELIEGPTWAAMMCVARADTMVAAGALNTAGNLGGLIGIPLVAYLSGHGMWTTAFVIGAVFALISGLVWLWIDASRSFDESRPQATAT